MRVSRGISMQVISSSFGQWSEFKLQNGDLVSSLINKVSTSEHGVHPLCWQAPQEYKIKMNIDDYFLKGSLEGVWGV